MVGVVKKVVLDIFGLSRKLGVLHGVSLGNMGVLSWVCGSIRRQYISHKSR